MYLFTGGVSSPWQFRRLCFIPYIVIFFVTLACVIAVILITSIFEFRGTTVNTAALDGNVTSSNNQFFDSIQDYR